ncbi:hypothetical protein [Burkholderia sp. Bp9143]|uniref:hypothetical protein n=1 Tax=Burkholderia sp. Bp9143 TaxID=2184574 RepID=UPI000F5B572A|nr:hypothetical protein [Burkholderia sp. Bp9143]
MKQPKGVVDLAARLGAAAASPLVPVAAAAAAPVPAPAAAPAMTAEAPSGAGQGAAASEAPVAPARKAAKATAKKEPADTTQLTLRPSRALLARYVAAAADRSRDTGRMVSAQEIMLEVLEKGGV